MKGELTTGPQRPLEIHYKGYKEGENFSGIKNIFRKIIGRPKMVYKLDVSGKKHIKTGISAIELKAFFKIADANSQLLKEQIEIEKYMETAQNQLCKAGLLSKERVREYKENPSKFGDNMQRAYNSAKEQLDQDIEGLAFEDVLKFDAKLLKELGLQKEESKK